VGAYEPRGRMIHAVVFSRDRAAQLDLCLRSIETNASWIDRTTVIFRPTSDAHRDGYELVKTRHRDARFMEERGFQGQVLDALKHGEFVMFVCDDDVFYGRIEKPTPTPDVILNLDPRVVCVSTRLGANTTRCYSLRTDQQVPDDGNPTVMHWRWRDAHYDFAYPGSLDGHVFRADELTILISATGWDHEIKWSCPNELEDHLHRAVQSSLLPLMACYRQSLLVGVPVNRVNDTHKRNRYGELWPVTPEALNERLLRTHDALSLTSVLRPNSAHCEFPLVWQQDVARSAA
jgi:hypothetical protein